MRAPMTVVTPRTQPTCNVATFCCAAFGARIVTLRPRSIWQPVWTWATNVVQECMFTARKHLKVIQRIVPNVTINMMNDLVFRQWPTKMLFHQDSMHSGALTVWSVCSFVTGICGAALVVPAIPCNETGTTAEFASCSVADSERCTALLADGSWGRIVGHRKLLSFGVMPGLFAQRPASCFPQVYQENRV